jgi:deoxyribose-phosphate aldolase
MTSTVKSILKKGLLQKSGESLSLIFSCIDLTSLNTNDSNGKIRSMCKKVNDLQTRFTNYPNVAAICVYPSLIPSVYSNLKADGVGIASVAGGFPSSQTFLELKLAESKQAVNLGATEIDIVMSVGKFLEGDHDGVAEEIYEIKKAIGETRLKVILETGLLPSPGDIYRASELCIRAGADFIKTSTGTLEPAASLEAVLIMCEAIRDHYMGSGRKIGIKPAGGITTTLQALQYSTVVMNILGEEWLNPQLFRFGASRLANRVLEDLHFLITGNKLKVQYF